MTSVGRRSVHDARTSEILDLDFDEAIFAFEPTLELRLDDSESVANTEDSASATLATALRTIAVSAGTDSIFRIHECVHGGGTSLPPHTYWVACNHAIKASKAHHIRIYQSGGLEDNSAFGHGEWSRVLYSFPRVGLPLVQVLSPELQKNSPTDKPHERESFSRSEGTTHASSVSPPTSSEVYAQLMMELALGHASKPISQFREIQRRLSWLVEDAEELFEMGRQISLPSFRGLLIFLHAHPEFKTPSIGATDTGNISAVWAPEGKARITLEFIDDHRAKWMVADARASERRGGAGYDTIERLDAILMAQACREWMIA